MSIGSDIERAEDKGKEVLDRIRDESKIILRKTRDEVRDAVRALRSRSTMFYRIGVVALLLIIIGIQSCSRPQLAKVIQEVESEVESADSVAVSFADREGNELRFCASAELPYMPSLHVAADLARRFEGVRLEPYRDSDGYPTIGYGHLLSTNRRAQLSEWQPITKRHAECLLLHDLKGSLSAVDSLVTVPLTLMQRAALTDFTFNEGVRHFANSTLLAKVNAQASVQEIRDQFLRWDRAGRRHLAGLRARRFSRDRALGWQAIGGIPPPRRLTIWSRGFC